MKYILLTIGLLFAQRQDDLPEEGKPLSCDNHIQTPEAHRCACDRAMQKCNEGTPHEPADVRMDKKCKTYCREQHCQCSGKGCTS